MFQGLKDVFSSGRSVFGLIILLSMIVFVITGDMTVQQWQSSAEWVLAIVVGAQTATTVTGIIKNGGGGATIKNATITGGATVDAHVEQPKPEQPS